MNPVNPVMAGVQIYVKKIKNGHPRCGIRIRNVRRFCESKESHRLFWLALLCGFGVYSRADATTIAIIWTPQRVVIAADSLRNTRTGRSNACKIVQVGKVFVVGAGLVAYGPCSFSLWTEATPPFVDQFKSFSGAFNTFKMRASAGYNCSTERLSNTAPEFFERFVANRFLDMAAILSDGLVVRLEVSWMLWKRLAGQERVRIGSGESLSLPPPKGIPDQPVAVMLGIRDHAEAYIAQNPRWYEDGLEKAARRFVEMEAKEHPLEVGGAISILTVTPFGAWWEAGARGLCDTGLSR